MAHERKGSQMWVWIALLVIVVKILSEIYDWIEGKNR